MLSSSGQNMGFGARSKLEVGSKSLKLPVEVLLSYSKRNSVVVVGIMQGRLC